MVWLGMIVIVKGLWIKNATKCKCLQAAGAKFLKTICPASPSAAGNFSLSAVNHSYRIWQDHKKPYFCPPKNGCFWYFPP
jgi:hypothetical protein